MTSWTSWGDRPERATASRTTIAPSWGAVNDLRAPRNLPVGRRTAERITGSRMFGVSIGTARGRGALEVARGRLEEAGPDLRVRDPLRLRAQRGGGFRGACGRSRRGRLRPGLHGALHEAEGVGRHRPGHLAQPAEHVAAQAMQGLP